MIRYHGPYAEAPARSCERGRGSRVAPGPPVTDPRRPARCRAATVLVLGLAAAGAVGCENGDNRAATVASDSAGVRVSTYFEDASPLEEWNVDANPALEVGGREQQGPAAFSRIVGVVLNDNATVAVADAGSNEIRFFDSAGRFVRAVGGRGHGPTEFTDLVGIRKRGEALYAFDGPRLVKVLDAGGAFVRSVRLEHALPELSLAGVVGVMENGSFVSLAGGAVPALRAVGLVIDSAAILLLSPNGSGGKLLAAVPFAETADRGRLHNAPIAFGAQLASAAVADRVCTGWPRSFEIRCIDENGALKQILRFVETPAAVGSRERIAWANAYREAAKVARARSRPGLDPPDPDEVVRTTRFAEELPYFASLLGAETGDLWVREYTVTDGLPKWGRRVGDDARSAPIQYRVLSADGTWIARVRVPPHFDLLHVGKSTLAGVARDEYDVERVVVYRLERARR